MSLVSHQMSQPLSSMASLSELLATDWDELPEDIRRDLARKIDRNTRRLTTMVQDMTLLFRLDAGAVTARRLPVPVHEVAQTVIASLPEPAPEVRCDVDPELYALIDRGHLTQILTHLITNAIKYGDPPVEVAARAEPDAVVITVSDRGPGIPDDVITSMFERFARGRGLGLFIVRHLAEANGGAVWYEPVIPRGAQLSIRLERT